MPPRARCECLQGWSVWFKHNDNRHEVHSSRLNQWTSTGGTSHLRHVWWCLETFLVVIRGWGGRALPGSSR